MIETGHNLVFQEASLPDSANGAERLSFLKRVPNQPKIDAFLRAHHGDNPSPRFAEFFDLIAFEDHWSPGFDHFDFFAHSSDF